MKKYMFACMATSLILGFGQAEACPKALPEEYDQLQVESLQFQNMINVSLEQKEMSLKVNHEVKGSDVYIECLLDNFILAKEKIGKSHVEGEGHLYLYVDGHKVDTIAEPAFIVKGLPTGKHTIKLELIRNDQKTYGLEEEFSVQVL